MALSTHQEYHGWVGLSTQLSKRQQQRREYGPQLVVSSLRL